MGHSAMAEAKTSPAFEGGEVLFTGGTDWQALGRAGGTKKKTDAATAAVVDRQSKYPNITLPTRLSGLQVTSSQRQLLSPATPCAA